MDARSEFEISQRSPKGGVKLVVQMSVKGGVKLVVHITAGEKKKRNRATADIVAIVAQIRRLRSTGL